MNIFSKIIDSILNLIAPPKCATCSARVETINTLCTTCWQDLVFINDPKCEICSNTFPVNQFEKICIDCKTHIPAFDKVISSVVYNDISEQIIFGLKYNDRIDCSEIIAEFIKNSIIRENEKPDVIIPVPLHKNKLKKRGYNQATLIAKKLAKKLNVKIEFESLVKVKDNISQSGLNREERFVNVENVYKLNQKTKDRLKGKSVFLVDDVITTGATVNECAKLIKRARVKNVTCVSFARAVK